MKYQPLGNTGLRVSQLSFGAASLGEEYGTIDPAEGERSVHFAIDQGINYFDVAPYYGATLAESRLGSALVGKRDRVIVATKVGRYKDPQGNEIFDFTSRSIRENLEQSLRRLRTDAIDVYQAHDIEFVPRRRILEEALPTLYDLQREGKIRFVGITAYPVHLLKDIAQQADVDTILSYSRYHLLDTSLDDVLVDLAPSKGIGLINASPLNMGLLTAKGPPEWHPAPDSVKRKAGELAELCRSHGSDLSELAMQFALNYSGVATTLVGMSKVRHVQRNLDVLAKPIDGGLLRAARELSRTVANLCWQEGLVENHDPGSVPPSATM